MLSQATFLSKAGWSLAVLSAFGLASALAIGNALAGDGRAAGARAQPAVSLRSATGEAGAAGVQFQLAQETEIAKTTDVNDKTPLASEQKPRAKTPLGDAAEAERRLLDKLRLPARMEFVETPLADVVEFLKDEFEMSIGIDKKALEGQGIDTNTPITANLNGISLRAALRRTLSQIQLCYVVRDEMLVVTTLVDAAADFSPKIYPVADLLEPDGDPAGELQQLSELIKAATGTGTWVGSPVGPNLFTDENARGTITPHGRNLLVISQSWPVHEQIELFLADLRKHHKK